MKRVLLFDLEEATRKPLCSRLELDGYSVIECATDAEATGRFREGADVAVLCNLHPGNDGVHLLREFRAIDPNAPVVMVANSSSETLEALRQGAYYVTRAPWTPEEVSLLVQRALGSAAIEEPPPASDARPGLDYRLPTNGIDFRELEREVLTQALRIASGNQTRAASLLGLTRDQIRYRMAKFGMMTRVAERVA